MKPKTTKIDLGAVSRLDPEPLRRRLKAFGNLKTDIAALKERRKALDTEVRDLVENGNVDDEERIQLIAAKRTRLEILPFIVAKSERQLADDAAALLSEADKFRDGLRRFYDDVHAAVASSVAGIIGRYFSGEVNHAAVDAAGATVDQRTSRALVVATGCDDCREVSERKAEAERIQFPVTQPRSNFPDSHDAQLIQSCEALLSLAERP